VANGSKTQLSQIAREKHELELRVKRAEGAEVELKRLTEVNRNLEISNVSLRVWFPSLPSLPSSSLLFTSFPHEVMSSVTKVPGGLISRNRLQAEQANSKPEQQ